MGTLVHQNLVITKDGIKLSLASHNIKDPKAYVILVHGLGEYKKRYKHLAKAFNDAGYSFYVYDIRGHGDSEGKRGHTPSYKHLLDDLEAVIHFVNKDSGKPVVLYGHSMGGNIVANFLIKRGNSHIKVAIITSPWFRLKMKASSFKLILGQLALKIIPGLSQNTNLNPDFLSHDPNVVNEYREDPKVHTKITPSLFFSVRDSGEYAIEDANKIKIPILVTHGTGDNITDVEATKEFAKNAGNYVTLKLWPDMYHETHNEVDKQRVINYNISWLEKHFDQ